MNIGIGHMIRGMQAAGFGHEEIMAMKDAMIHKNFKKINFCSDTFYNEDCDDYVKPKGDAQNE